MAVVRYRMICLVLKVHTLALQVKDQELVRNLSLGFVEGKYMVKTR